MRISIITVCYNSENTLEHTIESIRSQSYSNFEYIVIDGKSRDGTLSLIKENLDIIDHFISEPDEGLYDAMNKGVRMATGDIIGILNSDDVFADDQVLERLAQFHKTNDIMASVGNIIKSNDQGKLVRKYRSEGWQPQRLKRGFMPPHPAIFFKKELFDCYGYYRTDFKIGADYELIVRLFLKHKISWQYSGITTTNMLAGGLSDEGLKSYLLISREIIRAFRLNEIRCNPVFIHLRGIVKLLNG